MDYTRGNDILSALKYFYQNKYGIDTAILAECRSIPEVICVAERLQIPQNEGVILSGNGVELINSLGIYYEKKKSQNKSTNKFSGKKNKRDRFVESPKSDITKPIVAENDKNTKEVVEETHV